MAKSAKTASAPKSFKSYALNKCLIGYGVVNGIITGKTTKILAPTATATRAEAAAMLLRMVELMK